MKEKKETFEINGNVYKISDLQPVKTFFGVMTGYVLTPQDDDGWFWIYSLKRDKILSWQFNELEQYINISLNTLNFKKEEIVISNFSLLKFNKITKEFENIPNFGTHKSKDFRTLKDEYVNREIKINFKNNNIFDYRVENLEIIKNDKNLVNKNSDCIYYNNNNHEHKKIYYTVINSTKNIIGDLYDAVKFYNKNNNNITTIINLEIEKEKIKIDKEQQMFENGYVFVKNKNKILKDTFINKDADIRTIDNERLNEYINEGGYKYVYLRNGSANVHNIMCNTFIKNDYLSDGYVCDHINRDRRDNRLENLRVVSHRENSGNKINNSVHGVGVQQTKSGKFKANININKKNVVLGTFDTAEEASNKYQSVKNQIEEIEKISRSYSFDVEKIKNEYFLIFMFNTIVNSK